MYRLISFPTRSQSGTSFESESKLDFQEGRLKENFFQPVFLKASCFPVIATMK